MVTEKIKELEATKAKIVALEKTIATQLEKELAGLPATYGFDSVSDFIKAVVTASGGRRRKSKGRDSAPKAPRKTAGGRRKRSVITDETRATVKKLVDEGKTGSQIAEALSISLPTVQNIKKALGLVKARGTVQA